MISFDHLVLLMLGISSVSSKVYQGRLMGTLKTGPPLNSRFNVYAMDEQHLYVEDFRGHSIPSDVQFLIQRRGRGELLTPLENKDAHQDRKGLILSVPEKSTIREYSGIMVTDRQRTLRMGHLAIPRSFSAPKPFTIGPLPTFAHEVRADAVIIKDSKTIEILNLHYDGKGPNAFFMVGKGQEPHGEGIVVPDENGSVDKLHKYTGQNVVLRLPDSLTVFDIDWFSLYCIRFKNNFGSVKIPKHLRNRIPANYEEMIQVRGGGRGGEEGGRGGGVNYGGEGGTESVTIAGQEPPTQEEPEKRERYKCEGNLSRANDQKGFLVRLRCG